jgi:hypothetical protein
MKMVPHWPLARVQALARLPDGLFVQVSRARAFFVDRRSAIAACRAAISALTLKDFARSQELTWDIADIYAVRMPDGAGWYLKITIDESVPEVAVISFHPLERSIVTNGGVVKP